MARRRTTKRTRFLDFSNGSERVGHGGLFTSGREPGSIELGYAVLPPHWRHGYATEMASAFLEMAREHRVPSLVALTREENVRSQRVLAKLGLTRAGRVHVDDVDYVRYSAGA